MLYFEHKEKRYKIIRERMVITMANVFDQIAEKRSVSSNDWTLEEELILVKGLANGHTVKQIAADIKAHSGREAEQSLQSYKARARGLVSTKERVTAAAQVAAKDAASTEAQLLEKYGFSPDDFIA